MHKATKTVIGAGVIVLIPLLILATCTPNQNTINKFKKELPLVEYTVQGRLLECVYRDVRSLSCNWEKYNRLVDSCEASSKERRTVVTKEGETLIFPATKGEC